MLKKSLVKSRNLYRVTFEVPEAELPEGLQVDSFSLVGEFNSWDTSATLMEHNDGKKVFRATLELEPGREYQFRYLINGQQWCNDWNAEAYTPNGFGEDNCVLRRTIETASKETVNGT
jgi:1,4-alpha-glucan branching enzyme